MGEYSPVKPHASHSAMEIRSNTKIIKEKEFGKFEMKQLLDEF